ncbi:PTS system, glucose-specific IIA component [Selenomonas sp. GACV-9]|uniref:PTS sugar transporter subunit IIA n=1 Tax=Selenomonas sp. GACV-9 TaxID=3158782 RepID=UPI0008E9A090|nr:PTS system, glucose-specific IIA component [Selenomonas ruminantium]
MTTPTRQLIAPMSGKTLDLATVPDPVFSEKLTGDGLAIAAESDTVVAPCDGVISLFFDTKHAFAITTDDGVQVLVHIGLDSIIMNGQGITPLHQRGDQVKAGEPILKLDLPLLQKHKINLISPVLIVNYDTVRNLTPRDPDQMVTCGTDPILSYTK